VSQFIEGKKIAQRTKNNLPSDGVYMINSLQKKGSAWRIDTAIAISWGSYRQVSREYVGKEDAVRAYDASAQA
jgi:hypothetical protein